MQCTQGCNLYQCPGYENLRYHSGVAYDYEKFAAQALELMLSVGLEPLEPYPGSGDPWKCKCIFCGQVTRKRYISVQQTKTNIGCQKCSQTQKTKKARIPDDDARNFFREMKLEPIGDYPGSGKPWQSKCLQCGRVQSRSYTSLKESQAKWNTKLGCNFCNRNVVDVNFMSEVLRRFGLIPIEEYINNQTPRTFECANCGSLTKQTWTNIQRKVRLGFKSYGCKKCSFDQMGRRYSAPPELVRQRFLVRDLEIIGEYKTARLPVKCKCLRCGAITVQTLNGVKNGKRCRFCAARDIQHSAPAYIYIMENTHLLSLKIGIGNTDNFYNDRIKVHAKSGWKLISKWNVDTGDAVQAIEKRLLIG